MTFQWQRANPAEHDYGEDWDFAHDGYLKVFVHRTIEFTCDLCGEKYHHFFVSHADWAKVPLTFRSDRLCVNCYAASLS